MGGHDAEVKGSDVAAKDDLLAETESPTKKQSQSNVAPVCSLSCIVFMVSDPNNLCLPHCTLPVIHACQDTDLYAGADADGAAADDGPDLLAEDPQPAAESTAGNKDGAAATPAQAGAKRQREQSAPDEEKVGSLAWYGYFPRSHY